MSLFDMLSKNTDEPKISKKKYESISQKLVLRAEKSAKKGDINRASWLYQRLAITARRAGEWDDGIKYALLSAEYAQNEENIFNCGWGYRAAALAAIGKKDFRAAVDYAIKAAEKFRDSGSVYAAQWCYKVAAEASIELNKIDDAIKFYERALMIEEDDDIQNEIYRLKHRISHPKVDQYADKNEATEGENIKFEAVVENHAPESLKNIVIGDREGKVMHEIKNLAPGEVKIVTHESAGKPGIMQSPFNFITWENKKGQVFDFDLNPINVRVRPKLQITSVVEPVPVAGDACKLVVLVKNLSVKPVYDVKVDVDLGENVKAPRSSPKRFEKIEPGNEYGASWSMKIYVPGKQTVAKGTVTIHDENGVEYTEKIPPVTATVHETKPEDVVKEVTEEKPRMDVMIVPYEITEMLYTDLEKKFFHQQRGCTFRGIKGSVVLRHVKENCSDMHLVAEHRFKDEVMLLYSFNMDSIRHLMTVVIKKSEGLVYLIIKLYSETDKGLDVRIGKIADIIRHTIMIENDVHEVDKVEIKKVVNIIDSVVQRTKIGNGDSEETEKDVNIKDSVVQRTKT